MRALLCLSVIALLSGCYCAVEPGQSRSPGDYWDGCWKAAKDNKRGQILLPRGDL
jgi:hypothetical protein